MFTQVRDDCGLDQHSSSGGGGPDSGFVLKVEPIRFAKELASEYERNVSQVLGLSNWNDEAAIYSFEKVYSKLRWIHQVFGGRVKFNVFVTHLNRHHDPGVQRCVGWRENLRVTNAYR